MKVIAKLPFCVIRLWSPTATMCPAIQLMLNPSERFLERSDTIDGSLARGSIYMY